MAASSSKMTPEMKKALREMFQAAQSDGSLSNLMHELMSVEAPDEFELVQHGSMTDGSKRRKDEPPESPVRDHQLPISPDVTKSAAEYGDALPQGVDSVATWGKTLVQAGKLHKAGLSYQELMDSKNREHQNYVGYLYSQRFRLDLTEPVKDMVCYINVRTNEHLPNAPNFDGSNVRRQFKK